MGRQSSTRSIETKHASREANRKRLQFKANANVACGGTAARRFQRRHRNSLWQSDIKYGPFLPIGPGGTSKQTYLVVFIDDATRFVVHAAFYDSLEQAIVEDAFRKAIQQYGVPEAVYFDNGKQYRTKWMGRTCSKLGIRLLFAKPYSPESKGKVERLNGAVGSFLNEVVLKGLKPSRRLTVGSQHGSVNAIKRRVIPR